MEEEIIGVSVKLEIQNYEDRENMIKALANAGYFVRVDKETYLANDYIVFLADDKRQNMKK
jgi:hypothetical protein